MGINEIMPYKDKEYAKAKYREKYKTDPVFRARCQANSRRNYDPLVNHRRHLKYKYGLRWEDYLCIQKKQNNRCAICLKKPSQKATQKRLHTDHDHTTGKVRGLLCFYCNHRVGWYEKNKQAIETYLAKAKQLCS